MKFCSACGSGDLAFRVPAGDTLPRHVCEACGTVHYQNPKVVTGCLPEWDDRVLLCKRAIEPRRGLWTLPAGFLENGESLQAGAMRETLEEAGAHVALGALYVVISLPQISQVDAMFRGRLPAPGFSAGAERLGGRLFGGGGNPWGQMAVCP